MSYSPAVITVRLIRSFIHRNIKHIVLHDIDLSMKICDFIELVNTKVKSATNIPPPLRNYKYDTLKIEHVPHGAKSNDPVINREDDDKLILGDFQKSLCDYGVVNETVISFFKIEEYKEYKASPTLAW